MKIIRTFGTFLIEDEAGNLNTRMNSKSLRSLLLCLIVRPDHCFPTPTLLEYIAGGWENPERSFANLLSKAKMVVEKKQGIIKLSEYALTRLDTHLFTGYVRRLPNISSDQECITCGEMALSLYRGVFLPEEVIWQYEPKHSNDSYNWRQVVRWAAEQRGQLVERYLELMTYIIPALLRTNQQPRAEKLIEKGIEMHHSLVGVCDRLYLMLRQENHSHFSRAPLMIPRSDKIQQLEHLVKTHRVVVLRGALKVGKTQLITDTLTQITPTWLFVGQPYHRFFFQTDEAPEQALVRLYSELTGTPMSEADDAPDIFVDECVQMLEEKGIVLILEDIDQLHFQLYYTRNVQINVWMKLIETVYQSNNRSKIVICTSLPGSFQGYPEMVLPGLSAAEGAQLLAMLGWSIIPAIEREQLSDLVEGRPGLLRLVSARLETCLPGTMMLNVQGIARSVVTVVTQQTYLKRYLDQTLHQNESLGLLRLAVVRIPLTDLLIEALLKDIGTRHALKNSYLRNGYLFSTGKTYQIWREVAWYIIARATSDDLLVAHEAMFDAFQQLLFTCQLPPEQKAIFTVEAAYHALQGQHIAEATELLTSLGIGKHIDSYAYSLRDVLVQHIIFGNGSLASQQEAVLAFWMAKATMFAHLLGYTVGTIPASWYYRLAWERVQEEGIDVAFAASVGYHYMWTLMREARLLEAQSVMQTALDYANRSGDVALMSKAYRGSANVALRLQEFEKAHAYLDVDRELLCSHPGMQDHKYGASLNLRANILFRQGRLREAFLTGIKAARWALVKGATVFPIGIYLDNAIAASLLMGRLRVAERLLQRAEQAKQRTSNRRPKAYGALRRAQLAVFRGQWSQAQDQLAATRTTFEIIDRGTLTRETVQSAAETIREAFVWANAHQRTVDVTPIDYRWYEAISAILPLDIGALFQVTGPAYSANQGGPTGMQPPDTATFAGLRNKEKERFFKGEIDAPSLIHPSLARLNSDFLIKRLNELRLRLKSEQHPIVRNLYTETIDEGLLQLAMLDAASRGDGRQAQIHCQRLYGEPTQEQVAAALSQAFSIAWRTLDAPELPEQLYTQAHLLLSDVLVQHSLVRRRDVSDIFFQSLHGPGKANQNPVPVLSLDHAERAFKAALAIYGLDDPCTGWKVIRSSRVESTAVYTRQRYIMLPENSNSPWTLDRIRSLLSHEIEGHVLRTEAGRRSRFRLLGIGFQGNLDAEEALASMRNVPEKMPALDDGCAALIAIGLALGTLDGQPRSFRQVYEFLRAYFLLKKRGEGGEDCETFWYNAEIQAYRRCLRTYRGGLSPDAPLWCYTKDLAYARGRRTLATMTIGRNAAYNQRLLNILRVGRTSFHRHHLDALRDLSCCEPVLKSLDLGNNSEFIRKILM